LSSKDRFQNLRRILNHGLSRASFDEALVLPNLEAYFVSQSLSINVDTSAARAALKSVNLPNLRRLIIHHGHGEGNVGQIYDSIIPQLDHLSIYGIHHAEVEHLLLLSISFQTLSVRCDYHDSLEGFSKVFDQLSRLDVTELVLHSEFTFRRKDNWEAEFESIGKLQKVVEGKDQ
jgi:hypothetical protein